MDFLICFNLFLSFNEKGTKNNAYLILSNAEKIALNMDILKNLC
jgi:hypothetical protein